MSEQNSRVALMTKATNRFKTSELDILKFRHTREASKVKYYQDVWSKAQSKNWLSRKYYLLKLHEELGLHIWSFIISIVFGTVTAYCFPILMKIKFLQEYETLFFWLAVVICMIPSLFGIYVLLSAEHEFNTYADLALSDEAEAFEALKAGVIKAKEEKAKQELLKKLSPELANDQHALEALNKLTTKGGHQ